MHWRDCTQCCVLVKIRLCSCCVPACPAGAMHTMDAAVCAHVDTLCLLRPICKCLASGCLSMSLTLSSSMRAGSLCRLSLSQTPARCALKIDQVSIISRIPLHGTKLCAFHASTAHLCYIHCEKVQSCDHQHASLTSSQLSHCHDAIYGPVAGALLARQTQHMALRLPLSLQHTGGSGRLCVDSRSMASQYCGTFSMRTERGVHVVKVEASCC